MKNIIAILMLTVGHVIGYSAYAIPVPAAEAGTCSFSSVSNQCAGMATKICERNDMYNPLESHTGSIKWTSITTSNCSAGPNGPSVPCGTITGAQEYSTTYTPSISATISGGEAVQTTLNATLGYSSESQQQFMGTCTGNPVLPCTKAYIELRVHQDLNRTASVNHAYSCTLQFGTQPTPVCSRCTDCTAYNNQNIVADSCSGGSSSKVFGNKWIDWECADPVITNCVTPCCLPGAGGGGTQ